MARAWAAPATATTTAPPPPASTLQENAARLVVAEGVVPLGEQHRHRCRPQRRDHSRRHPTRGRYAGVSRTGSYIYIWPAERQRPTTMRLTGTGGAGGATVAEGHEEGAHDRHRRRAVAGSHQVAPGPGGRPLSPSTVRGSRATVSGGCSTGPRASWPRPSASAGDAPGQRPWRRSRGAARRPQGRPVRCRRRRSPVRVAGGDACTSSPAAPAHHCPMR